MAIWIDSRPDYHSYDVPEYSGNPLIEAMVPPPAGHKDALRRLIHKPIFHGSERELADAVRMTLPVRLSNFFFPMGRHVRILNRIYAQIFSGYVGRNPLTCEGQSRLYGSKNIGTTFSQGNHLPMAKPGTIMVISGLSGMGKSTLMKALMASLGKPVIEHSNYRGKAFTEKQLLYLMRNVPDQCSARALCISLCRQAAVLIGQPDYERRARSNTLTRREAVELLAEIVANFHIGALVIDELQNISLAHSGGADEVLALIHNLRDELGVPLILIGTYKVAALIMRSAAVAQRVTEMGFHDLERPLSCDDPDWRSLCEIAWGYQWVKDPAPWDEDINETLYECSQGITRIMLFVFIASQMEAIENGTERVDAALLKSVFQNRFRPLHPIVQALKSGKQEFLEVYDDLCTKAFDALKSDSILSRAETIRRAVEQAMQEPLGMITTQQAAASGDEVDGGTAEEKKSMDSEELAAALSESQRPSPVGI